MMRIDRKLVIAIVASLAGHLFYFFSIEFNFNSISSRVTPTKIYFLGQLLDKVDFSILSSSIEDKERRNFSGQAKGKGILYKRDVFLDQKIGLFDNDTFFFKKVNFLEQKKPCLVYDALNTKETAIFPLDGQEPKDLRQNAVVLKQRLANPFFYKELPVSEIEAEFKITSQGNILLVRRILSSGDLEVDLFVIKTIRRRLYLGDKSRGLRLKRIRIIIDND